MTGSVVIVTGSAGLIGSQAARRFHREGLEVVGLDNDMRAAFFGAEASTKPNLERLKAALPGYRHLESDIRDEAAIDALFKELGPNIAGVIHTAAQPSHDWAASDPMTDFSVNATGTLNLLQATRAHAPEAVFIYTSTNKVYGDAPNRLPLEEQETRWEISESHDYHAHGIPEDFSIDHAMHSLFGVSKASADLMVQEYGRYFAIPTACFRGGCLTGPGHAGTELHGFLAYLMKCVATGRPYTVIGYGGKQVRDNIHSADLVEAFWQFFKAPRVAEVYNIGGGREVNCSMLEAIALSEEIAGKTLDWSYREEARMGDHIWWVSDTRRFKQHYPDWGLKHNLRQILEQICEAVRAD